MNMNNDNIDDTWEPHRVNLPNSLGDPTDPPEPAETGSPLDWEETDPFRIRGFLKQDPGTTLYMIEVNRDKPNLGRLFGAFISDKADGFEGSISSLKAWVAPSFLNDWLFKLGHGQTYDGPRLEWAVTHSATVKIGERMKTRRGGFDPENLEKVYQCEWINDDGDLVLQSVDCRYQSMREAIDAAMKG